MLRGRLFGYHAESPGGLSRFRQHAWQLRKTCYNCLFMNGNLAVVPVYTGMVARWQVFLRRASPVEHHSIRNTAKVFFTSNFSDLHLAIPPAKNETGTVNRWGTTNSKPHGPIIMMGQSETLSSSHITFSTLFSATCTTVFAGPLTSHCRLCKNAAPKLFWHLSRYVYILTFLLLCRIT